MRDMKKLAIGLLIWGAIGWLASCYWNQRAMYYRREWYESIESCERALDGWRQTQAYLDQMFILRDPNYARTRNYNWVFNNTIVASGDPNSVIVMPEKTDAVTTGWYRQ